MTMNLDQTKKYCSSCGELKTLEYFSKERYVKSRKCFRYSSLCKICKSIYDHKRLEERRTQEEINQKLVKRQEKDLQSYLHFKKYHRSLQDFTKINGAVYPAMADLVGKQIYMGQ